MYPRRRSRKITARNLFLLVLGIALALVWLPSSWTRPLTHVTQLLAPVEDALTRVGASAADRAESATLPPISPDQFERSERHNQALSHTVSTLSARVQELEELNHELTGLRQAGPLQGGLLIPARVIRRDAAAWRDSVLLDRGTTSSSSDRDWVVSHRFVDAGGESGVADGMAVLAGEVLVGRVLAAAPYTSVVVLLSDPTQRTPVRIARNRGDRLEILPVEFLLQGRGRGRLQIEDVDHKYVESKKIRQGDLVVSGAGDASLPISMVIGRIERIEPAEESPLLLYRISVEPATDLKNLRRVYILDTSPGTGP